MLDTKRPRHVPGYQMELLDGEMVLLHPASLKIVHSNESGALVWELCDGQRTVADIIQLLSQAYPDSASQIGGDVREILQTLAQHGAIEWV